MNIHTLVARSFHTAGAIVLVGLASLLASGAIAQESRPGAGPGGQAPNPDAFVDRMMQSDANGDGKLSKDEVPGNFADRLFETGDADKDGFLTRDELKAIAASFPGGRGGAGGQGGRGAGGPGGPGGGQEISFRGYMSQAGRSVRGLQRSAFDEASRESDLTAIGNIQAGLVGAKSRSATVPMAPQAKEKYGSDEAAYRRDLRKGLMKALAAALELESAIIDGDSAAAKACLGKLKEAQNAGHGAFQEEEEEGPGGPPPGGAPRGRGGEGAPGGGGN